MSVASNQILEAIEKAKSHFEEQVKAALAPARARLAEISRLRDELDSEESKLRTLLGESKPAAAASSSSRRRRSSGRRMSSAAKKEIVARFIQEGHIRNGGELSRSLRVAMMEAGIGVNDFRILHQYLPAGWSAKNNGQRGSASKTTFHQG